VLTVGVVNRPHWRCAARASLAFSLESMRAVPRRPVSLRELIRQPGSSVVCRSFRRDGVDSRAARHRLQMGLPGAAVGAQVLTGAAS